MNGAHFLLGHPAAKNVEEDTKWEHEKSQLKLKMVEKHVPDVQLIRVPVMQNLVQVSYLSHLVKRLKLCVISHGLKIYI